MSDVSTYERFVERYEAGEVPWDDELPPPEVIDLVAALLPGRALDLGCGYGRAAIFLAQQGWEVDGVDFVPQAVAEAAARARAAGVSAKTHFHAGSVAELGFLNAPYDLALDIGCLHALAEADLRACRDELRRLLRPGAIYLLFVRLREEEVEEGDGPRGLPEATIRALFAEGFALERSERSETQVEEKPPWASAWFRFRRR